MHREPVSREVDRPAGGPVAIASLATDEEELLSKLVHMHADRQGHALNSNYHDVLASSRWVYAGDHNS